MAQKRSEVFRTITAVKALAQEWSATAEFCSGFVKEIKTLASRAESLSNQISNSTTRRDIEDILDEMQTLVEGVTKRINVLRTLDEVAISDEQKIDKMMDEIIVLLNDLTWSLDNALESESEEDLSDSSRDSKPAPTIGQSKECQALAAGIEQINIMLGDLKAGKEYDKTLEGFLQKKVDMAVGMLQGYTDAFKGDDQDDYIGLLDDFQDTYKSFLSNVQGYFEGGCDEDTKDELEDVTEELSDLLRSVQAKFATVPAAMHALYGPNAISAATPELPTVQVIKVEPPKPEEPKPEPVKAPAPKAAEPKPEPVKAVVAPLVASLPVPAAAPEAQATTARSRNLCGLQKVVAPAVATPVKQQANQSESSEEPIDSEEYSGSDEMDDADFEEQRRQFAEMFGMSLTQMVDQKEDGDFFELLHKVEELVEKCVDSTLKGSHATRFINYTLTHTVPPLLEKTRKHAEDQADHHTKYLRFDLADALEAAMEDFYKLTKALYKVPKVNTARYDPMAYRLEELHDILDKIIDDLSSEKEQEIKRRSQKEGTKPEPSSLVSVPVDPVAIADLIKPVPKPKPQPVQEPVKPPVVKPPQPVVPVEPVKPQPPVKVVPVEPVPVKPQEPVPAEVPVVARQRGHAMVAPVLPTNYKKDEKEREFSVLGPVPEWKLRLMDRVNQRSRQQEILAQAAAESVPVVPEWQKRVLARKGQDVEDIKKETQPTSAKVMNATEMASKYSERDVVCANRGLHRQKTFTRKKTYRPPPNPNKPRPTVGATLGSPAPATGPASSPRPISPGVKKDWFGTGANDISGTSPIRSGFFTAQSPKTGGGFFDVTSPKNFNPLTAISSPPATPSTPSKLPPAAEVQTPASPSVPSQTSRTKLQRKEKVVVTKNGVVPANSPSKLVDLPPPMLVFSDTVTVEEKVIEIPKIPTSPTSEDLKKAPSRDLKGRESMLTKASSKDLSKFMKLAQKSEEGASSPKTKEEELQSPKTPKTPKEEGPKSPQPELRKTTSGKDLQKIELSEHLIKSPSKSSITELSKPPTKEKIREVLRDSGETEKSSSPTKSEKPEKSEKSVVAVTPVVAAELPLSPKKDTSDVADDVSVNKGPSEPRIIPIPRRDPSKSGSPGPSSPTSSDAHRHSSRRSSPKSSPRGEVDDAGSSTHHHRRHSSRRGDQSPTASGGESDSSSTSGKHKRDHSPEKSRGHDSDHHKSKKSDNDSARRASSEYGRRSPRGHRLEDGIVDVKQAESHDTLIRNRPREDDGHRVPPKLVKQTHSPRRGETASSPRNKTTISAVVPIASKQAIGSPRIVLVDPENQSTVCVEKRRNLESYKIKDSHVNQLQRAERRVKRMLKKHRRDTVRPRSYSLPRLPSQTKSQHLKLKPRSKDDLYGISPKVTHKKKKTKKKSSKSHREPVPVKLASNGEVLKRATSRGAAKREMPRPGGDDMTFSIPTRVSSPKVSSGSRSVRHKDKESRTGGEDVLSNLFDSPDSLRRAFSGSKSATVAGRTKTSLPSLTSGIGLFDTPSPNDSPALNRRNSKSLQPSQTPTVGSGSPDLNSKRRGSTRSTPKPPTSEREAALSTSGGSKTARRGSNAKSPTAETLEKAKKGSPRTLPSSRSMKNSGEKTPAPGSPEPARVESDVVQKSISNKTIAALMIRSPSKETTISAPKTDSPPDSARSAKERTHTDTLEVGATPRRGSSGRSSKRRSSIDNGIGAVAVVAATPRSSSRKHSSDKEGPPPLVDSKSGGSTARKGGMDTHPEEATDKVPELSEAGFSVKRATVSSNITIRILEGEFILPNAIKIFLKFSVPTKVGANKMKRTKVKDSNSAIWNEEFEVVSPLFPIKVECYMKDGDKNSLLGSFAIENRHALAGVVSKRPFTFSLKPFPKEKGSVTLELEYVEVTRRALGKTITEKNRQRMTNPGAHVPQ